MSIQQFIARKTQCNFRLNRKIIHCKHCWDTVSDLVNAAPCHNRKPAPPPPKPTPPRPVPPPPNPAPQPRSKAHF